jgi:peptidoglycan/LPS O-acetylase OafA/YrhL
MSTTRLLKLIAVFLFGSLIPFLFLKYSAEVNPAEHTLLENIAFALLGGCLMLIIMAWTQKKWDRRERNIISLIGIIGIMGALLAIIFNVSL